ncbi:MAG: hypothetical protein ACTTJC_02220 [Campylobacter sp.]
MNIIIIDKYIFRVENNIESLQKSLSVNFDKQNTITKPIYSHLGGFEEEISFDATILLDDMARFEGFEELVKKGEALKISAFDLVKSKYILIHSFIQNAENFTKTKFNGIWYFTRRLSIAGYIIEADKNEK